VCLSALKDLWERFCDPRTLSGERSKREDWCCQYLLERSRKKIKWNQPPTDINGGRMWLHGSNDSDVALQEPTCSALLWNYAFQNCLVTTVPVISTPTFFLIFMTLHRLHCCWWWRSFSALFILLLLDLLKDQWWYRDCERCVQWTRKPHMSAHKWRSAGLEHQPTNRPSYSNSFKKSLTFSLPVQNLRATVPCCWYSSPFQLSYLVLCNLGELKLTWVKLSIEYGKYLHWSWDLIILHWSIQSIEL